MFGADDSSMLTSTTNPTATHKLLQGTKMPPTVMTEKNTSPPVGQAPTVKTFTRTASDEFLINQNQLHIFATTYKEDKMFDKGKRVTTPSGPGTVVYCRFTPPTYSEPEAYSVCLDSKKAESERPPFNSYTGTIFKADMVKSEE